MVCAFNLSRSGAGQGQLGVTEGAKQQEGATDRMETLLGIYASLCSSELFARGFSGLRFDGSGDRKQASFEFWHLEMIVIVVNYICISPGRGFS